MSRNPLLELELRPIEAPAYATPGARVYVLLPRLEELLGAPGFGTREAILLSRSARAARFSSATVPRHLFH